MSSGCPTHAIGPASRARLLAAGTLLGLLAAGLQADPRIQLVELQTQRNYQQALERVEEILAEDPELARRLGLDYLRGHLLLLLERRREALQSFATTLSTTPKLSPYSRYRLALEQEEMGSPEVAAGLVATLLGANPPRPLVAPALVLLARTLEKGGDCRLLAKLALSNPRRSEQRLLALVNADCTLRRGDPDRARSMYLELLSETRDDGIARNAAERLHRLGVDPRAARAQLTLGLAFYSHREFDTAIPYLEQSLALLPRAGHLSRAESFECRYAVARSHFWEGRYRRAAATFAELAKLAPDAQRKAQAIYQKARCEELASHWDQAILSYRAALEADPSGRWADGALIAFMRLQWLLGREEAALSALEALAAQRRYGVFSRAALFLAASELVSGQRERAEEWLGRATRLGRDPPEELAYWRGRLLELDSTDQSKAAAVEAYLAAIRPEPNHPFALAARERLASPELAAWTRRAGLLKANGKGSDELYSAWLLLGEGHPLGLRARKALAQRLATDPATRPYLELRRLAPESWPLWKASLPRPEEMLLALGLFREAEPVVMRHFPVTQPPLAFTSSAALAEAGADHRSLYIAEVLQKRIPARLPRALLPEEYRRLLYPMGYSYLIRREASRRGIDPHLLAGIIREESRFQPRAFSGAAARGLTQFVFPTARRVAAKYGIGPITPDDLDRPEISIALGAAYLSELSGRFGGAPANMAAAYNAGEPQAELWRRYCLSPEPAELYTKIAFPETRKYVRRVLTSHAHYTDLYRPASPPAPAGEP